MQIVFEIGCIASLATLSIGTLLNLSRSPHWFVRGWDFPRVQILFVAVVIAAAYFMATRLFDSSNFATTLAVFGLLTFLFIWHGVRIAPYTVLAPVQTLPCKTIDPKRSLRVVVSNIEKENDQYERWMQVIRDAHPDILIVLEVDQVWMGKIENVRRDFRHEVAYPQDNWYGMLMLSNLPVVNSEIRFLVEADIPSIDVAIHLRSGDEIRVVAVHPRPPEPIRDNDSAARDAELVCYGKLLCEEKRGVVVGGDLNDVAWSATTRLFLKISRLLDPRKGRGFFNSFHAGHWWMRFPLDHLFHSQHFTLKKIARLSKVGSDHFPILMDLQYEPGRQQEQEALPVSREDHALADRLVRREDTADLADEHPPENPDHTA